MRGERGEGEIEGTGVDGRDDDADQKGGKAKVDARLL